MSAKRRDEDNKWKTFLNINNVTIDYCSYSSGYGLGYFFLDMFAKNLREHGNVIQPCPLQNHIYLRNYLFDLSSIPFFIPKGQYFGQLVVYMKNSTRNIILGGCNVYSEMILKNSRG